MDFCWDRMISSKSWKEMAIKVIIRSNLWSQLEYPIDNQKILIIQRIYKNVQSFIFFMYLFVGTFAPKINYSEEISRSNHSFNKFL